MNYNQRKLCKLYQEGNCFDAFCPDQHIQPNRPQGVPGLSGGGGRDKQNRFQGNDNKYTSNNQVDGNKEKTQICRNDQKGNCMFGDNCRYIHNAPTGGDDEQYSQKINDKDNRNNQLQKKKPCNQYAQTGECKYGDSCKYSHDQEDQQVNNNSENEDQDKRSKKICTYYSRNGYCNKEENCKFLHIKEGGGTLENTDGADIKKICQYNLMGKCRHGNACKFSHEGEQKSSQTVEASKVSQEEQNILKYEELKFSLINLGESNQFKNPKEVYSLGQRQLAAFYENGFQILRMITKKTKEELESRKKDHNKSRKQNEMEEESEKGSTGAHISQKGVILEAISSFQYPISKIIADKIFISSRRWVVVTFQNTQTLSYGFLCFDLLLCSKQAYKQTKCVAINIAHSERINAAEFCLKNEVFDQVQYNFTDQYKTFGTQDDLNSPNNNNLSLIEQKQQKEQRKIQRKQELIHDYINNLDNEIDQLYDEIDKTNADQELTQDQKEEKSREFQAKQEINRKIIEKYQEMYDQLQQERIDDTIHNDEGYDDENDCSDNEQESQNINDKNQRGRSSENNNDQSNESYADSIEEEIDAREMFEEDNDLLDSIENEIDYAKQLDSDEEDNQKSDLSDNFYFKQLLIESSYAKRLDDLLLFTSSKDGIELLNVILYLLILLMGEKFRG